MAEVAAIPDIHSTVRMAEADAISDSPPLLSKTQWLENRSRPIRSSSSTKVVEDAAGDKHASPASSRTAAEAERRGAGPQDASMGRNF